MGDYEILYICDRKACENCSEECRHTNDIDHAVNHYDFNGRMFQFLECGDGSGRVGFFEVE